MSVHREMTERLAKFRMIARKAKENPEMKFTSLAHYLSEEYLRDSYRNLNKTAASGIDEVDYYQYELEQITAIESLHHRLKTGSYQAPNNRRVWIDKGEGKKRALGISTTEDKIVQKSVTGILNLIYEQDFYPNSYGFRPNRSAHQALSQLRKECMRWGTNWIIDADIQGCFDNFDHTRMLEFLRKRITDRSLLRLIQNWLEAGIVDGKEVFSSERGTPQGNILSPLLCNIYLHYVLDQWIEETVKPLLKGRCFLIRYADDFVIGFSNQSDAERVMKTIPKRLMKYGLNIHPEKSRLLNFYPRSGNDKPPTFDFLGFTHYWTKSQKGRNVVKRRTREKSQHKALQNMHETCRDHRHEKVKQQYRRLKSKLQGIYNYFGIRGNYINIYTVYRHALVSWYKWLNRRSQRQSLTWQGYKDLLKQFPLPTPKVVHVNV